MMLHDDDCATIGHIGGLYRRMDELEARLPAQQPSAPSPPQDAGEYVGGELARELAMLSVAREFWDLLGLAARRDQDEARRQDRERIAELEANYELVLKNYQAEKIQRQALAIQRTEASERIAGLEAQVQANAQAARELGRVRELVQGGGGHISTGGCAKCDELRALLHLDGKGET